MTIFLLIVLLRIYFKRIKFLQTESRILQDTSSVKPFLGYFYATSLIRFPVRLHIIIHDSGVDILHGQGQVNGGKMHCIAKIIMLRPPVLAPPAYLNIDKVLFNQNVFFQAGKRLIGLSLDSIVFFSG